MNQHQKHHPRKHKKMNHQNIEQIMNPSNNQEILQILKESYQKKRTEFLGFLQNVIKTIDENKEKNNELEEEQHRQIIFQNFRRMMLEGNRIYFSKKETTPFKKLMLTFDDEEYFHKINRTKRICLDGEVRDEPIDYINYLLKDHEEEFQKILNEESQILRFEKKYLPNKMMENFMEQVKNEYHEYYDVMNFYHKREFTPITFFLILAELKF